MTARDHRMGYPKGPIEQELNEVFRDYEVPFKLGVPARIHEEARAFRAKFDAGDKRARDFEKGNHAFPDGTQLHPAHDLTKDYAARVESSTLELQRLVSAAAPTGADGAGRLHLGADPMTQLETLTVSVNVRLPSQDARELDALFRRDPTALHRLIKHLQAEIVEYLDMRHDITALAKGSGAATRAPVKAYSKAIDIMQAAEELAAKTSREALAPPSLASIAAQGVVGGLDKGYTIHNDSGRPIAVRAG